MKRWDPSKQPYGKHARGLFYLQIFLMEHDFGREALRDFLQTLPAEELAKILGRKLSVNLDFGSDPARMTWTSPVKKNR
jgi:hypothetical protein